MLMQEQEGRQAGRQISGLPAFFMFRMETGGMSRNRAEKKAGTLSSLFVVRIGWWVALRRIGNQRIVEDI